MQLPEVDGRRYVSTNQFRTYGAAGRQLNGSTTMPGCPRQYWARYIDQTVPPVQPGRGLVLGAALHHVLQIMEEDAVGPEDALAHAVERHRAVDYADWREAVDVLGEYLVRGGPMTRYATLATEIDIWSVLDPDLDPPVWFRCRLDWLGVDPDDGSLHVVDYKSNRYPPTHDQVHGDVQLLGQAWAVTAEASGLYGVTDPVVTVHLDALRYRDIAVQWTRGELDTWQEWARATARAILADDKAEPVLNPGCSWCPVAADCPVIEALPREGLSIAEREWGATFEEMWTWRTDAYKARKILDDRVKAIDAHMNGVALTQGGLAFGDQAWTVGDKWDNRIDLARLHDLLGDARFYDLASVTVTAVKDLAKRLPATLASQVLACVTREPVGAKVVKATTKGRDAHGSQENRTTAAG